VNLRDPEAPQQHAGCGLGVPLWRLIDRAKAESLRSHTVTDPEVCQGAPKQEAALGSPQAGH
jgi:hypothetical protein